MTVVAAVVHIVGAVEAGKQLKQKARFVTAAATEVPKGFVGRECFEPTADLCAGFFPRERAIVRFAPRVQQRQGQPPGCLQFARCHPLQLLDAVLGEELGCNSRLHIGGHRLHRLLTDLGKTACLVDHATLLATHADRTGLAGVF